MGPYRDELESLRAENERLRAALASRRRTPLWVTAALVVVDIAALVALQPWLNSASDVRFWGAVVILGATAVAASLTALSR